MDYKNIPVEKLKIAVRNEKIADKKLDTKPVGYFKDAFNRFKKNKSSVAAAVIIVFLLLYAFIVPFISDYSVDFRDGYYKQVLPKNDFLAQFGIWDGCSEKKESQAGYDYYGAIGVEYGSSPIKELMDVTVDANTGDKVYTIDVDSYEKVGFVYADLSHE